MTRKFRLIKERTQIVIDYEGNVRVEEYIEGGFSASWHVAYYCKNTGISGVEEAQQWIEAQSKP